jgi:magnesium chelatase subunit D
MMSPPLSKALQERLGLWFDLKDIAPSDVSEVSHGHVRPQDSTQESVGIQIAAEELAEMKQSLP